MTKRHSKKTIMCLKFTNTDGVQAFRAEVERFADFLEELKTEYVCVEGITDKQHEFIEFHLTHYPSSISNDIERFVSLSPNMCTKMA